MDSVSHVIALTDPGTRRHADPGVPRGVHPAVCGWAVQVEGGARKMEELRSGKNNRGESADVPVSLRGAGHRPRRTRGRDRARQ